MSKNNIYVGIDLATTGRKTGVCILSEAALGKPVFDRPNCKDDELVGELLGIIRGIKICNPNSSVTIGIDVPFGWPRDFCKSLQKHSVGKKFGTAVKDQKIIHKCIPRDSYRFRETDKFVRDELNAKLGFENSFSIIPISVSTQLLGVTAMVGSELVERLKKELGFSVQNGSEKQKDSKFQLIEVYPRASVFSWWLNTDKKLNKPHLTKTTKFMYEHMSFPKDSKPSVKSDHERDAWLCAMTAREFHKGKCFYPEKIPGVTLRKEGWIWVPLELTQLE